MINEIETKTILSKNKKPLSWFGITYNTNFYRGCPHSCIYCDSRSECYKVNNFDDIEIKINAPILLEKELSKRREYGTIGTGAMSDSYLPLERDYRITRKCLEVIEKYEYPVTIITKSDLVLDDIEMLVRINGKAKATVIFTITTTDDNLAKLIEPNAPSPTRRLKAMKELSDRGIYVGVTMMPILPFINDNVENIVSIVNRVAECGGKFIIPMFGVTLRDRQRKYFYDRLDESFQGTKEKYMKTYKEYYSCYSKKYNELGNAFKSECLKNGIVSEMNKVESYERLERNIQLGLDFKF